MNEKSTTAEPQAATPAAGGTQVESAQFQQLEPGIAGLGKERKMDLLLDLSLPVSIELGRTNLAIRDILDLQRGSVVEFEKLASEPVDILINGRKMAEGEVVVIEKHFAIRVTSLVEASERVKNLGK
ncbi:MAG TPA: flagellar motor switch protein FliN [Bacteroidota bacterium]|nr:flagellar motor switch protein FliN [Bacteroidota bacterium]